MRIETLLYRKTFKFMQLARKYTLNNGISVWIGSIEYHISECPYYRGKTLIAQETHPHQPIIDSCDS